ncbi:MAG TPA: ABC transporter permease [Candidatus Acidoferrales bacterium]|nr:ABC transporter permease [Candidatus Acidoferrales bacterium]
MTWQRFFRRKKWDAERARELDAYIESETAENVARGMSPNDARDAARQKLGNMTQIREEIYHMNSLGFLEIFLQDVRFALRMLRKNPGFTAIAVLTLALGIGANTAIFSVVYAVLLQPLPYKESSRLIFVNETTPRVGDVSVSYPNFLDWRADSRAFSQMAAAHQVSFSLAGVDQPENINGDAVSPNFLSMLGIHPFLGRDFEASEEKPGTPPVLMLSYSLWQSRLGGDPNALGKTITLDGRNFTIVGVLPPNYRSPDKTDVLLPIGTWASDDDESKDRGSRGDMIAIGRLAPGASLAQARVEMEGIAARLAKEYPEDNDRFGIALKPFRDVFVGDMEPAIVVLSAAVLFVLLIACANVANLFLVRGATRTREIALRIAFGAARGRIIRQMLTESFVLALFGGALGLALAVNGIHGMAQLITQDMLSGAVVRVNGPVLLFMAAVVVLAAFIFGLAPAAHLANPNVQSELKEGGRSVSASAAQNRMRGILAVSEISLALILLIGAGLMMKSLYRLMSVDPGFRADHVLKMEMDLRTQQYDKDPAIRTFWNQVLARVRALPGVESAAVGTHIPLTDEHGRSDITVEGMVEPSPGSYPHPDRHEVSSGYIEGLGISLLRGRTFSESDKDGAPLVAMVNEKFAKQFFANQDPIGKRFMFGRKAATKNPVWLTIVGVVSDTKMYGLANPARLEVYESSLQNTDNDMTLLVRSNVDPAALTSAIRGVVSSIDKDQPIFKISTMNQVVTDSVSTRRITLILLGLFSGLALILATIGIYGVISYSVSQRTHEIGIRMALGAHRGDVLRMVLASGGKIAIAGIAIGLAAAFGLTRLMASLLFSVSAFDPLTFAGVAILLTIVALAACYIPARRAMRVDPMVALRYE